jgi:hypothetical protein
MFRILPNREVETTIPPERRWQISCRTAPWPRLMSPRRLQRHPGIASWHFQAVPFALTRRHILWANHYGADKPVAAPIGAHCGGCQFDAPADSGLASRISRMLERSLELD